MTSFSKENVKVSGEKLTYWRSIDNRRRTAEYVASIENEFAGDFTDISSMDRRSMLKFMGASIALSGLGVGCRRPVEKILPYVKQPENYIAGIPNFFATAQDSPFGAVGLLVESHEGRPTKVEGNPSHPQSLGKASFVNQAAALEVYDPDRSRFPLNVQAGHKMPAEWSEWDSFFKEHLMELKGKSGLGLAMVFNSELSPTILRLKAKVKELYPKAKFYTHEPMRQLNVEEAAKLTFGQDSRVRYHFDQAKVIATIFCDPFSVGPEHLLHQKGFSSKRSVFKPEDAKDMNRLYAVEADFSLAGTNADHRLRLPVGKAVSLLRALAYELHATHGLDVKGLKDATSLSSLVPTPPSYKDLDKKFIWTMAKDLAQNKGQALIVGGDHLPASALGLIHVLNAALLGYKKTFSVVAIDDERVKEHLNAPGIKELAADLKAKKIETLMFMGVNPLYDAPKNLELKDHLDEVKMTIHVGQRADETGSECMWHLPATHFLEHFGDARAYDGLVSIVQPLIRPLHNARSILEILASMAGLKDSPRDLVKETFREKNPLDLDKNFDKAIHDGVVKDSQFSTLDAPSFNSSTIYQEFSKIVPKNPTKDSFELVLSFDRSVLDGRFSNHSWLQEMPDPVTKINWGNALFMSPTAAREFGLKSGVKKNAYVADMVKLSVENISLELPVFVIPGLADHTLVTTLGYGRSKAGDVGDNVGYDTYGLVSDYKNLVLSNVKLEKTTNTARISTTQEQFAMNGDVVQKTDVLSLRSRDPARMTNVADFVKNPTAAKEASIPASLLVKELGKKEKQPLQITDAWDYTKGNQWGMVIDLSKCTGCNACVIACQSENNIPVVGKEQVIRGRIMHWMRIDRYFVGDVKNPSAISQPVLCQHCENAPCEPVCPVAATSHDHEGLNVMTYNRCVGTRYCGNNCPYKVRRFNYFDFTKTGNLYVDEKDKARQKTIKLQRNPDVTVRYRGVMEKCTFCTQRIQEAKMVARREGRDHNNLPDGAVTPACAQTCPSEAITFGNINDEDSKVYALKNVSRNYTMLDILNARPRTSYLSMLRNPHPDLVA